MKRKVGGCSTTHSPERRFYHCRWPSILTPPSGCGHLYLYLVSVENQFCEDCVLSQFIHSAFLVREREMQMKLSCCYERERERERERQMQLENCTAKQLHEERLGNIFREP